MKKPYKFLIVIFILIIAVCSIISFVLNIRSISVPKKFEKIFSTEISSQADIYINNQGIPHIISTSDDDMFFAMGYFHALTRLWSMCNSRMIAEGRTAEVYGKKFFQLDLYMRTINLREIADELYKNSNPETKAALTAYSNGVNSFIENNINKLTFEFGTSDFLPEKWKPEDCFLMQRYWAFTLNPNFLNDIIMMEIVGKIGIEKAIDLIPNYPNDAPCVLDETSIHVATDKTNKSFTFAIDSLTKTYYNSLPFNSLKGMAKHLTEMRIITGQHGSNFGGNTWATNKAKSTIILANDAHLPLTIPCQWLQMHVSSPSYNVVGLTIPGMPIFLCGQNDSIAWGYSNMMSDDVDYYIHKTDKNQNHYFINDTIPKKITEKIDTIKIKNELDYLYYKRSIDNCILMSKNITKDYKTLKNSNTTTVEFEAGLTFKWTGQQKSDEFYSALKIMQTNNWNEFLLNLNHWACPGFVFSYADKKGNIGVAPRAYIPIRAKNVVPFLPFPYYKNANTWTEYVIPAALPTLFNPSKKFVFAANNELIRNNTTYISSTFALDARSRRIEDMLITGDEYSYRDAQYMQNDILSYYAKIQFPKILHIIEKHKNILDSNEKKVYDKLLNWDFIMATNSVSAMIYTTLVTNMLKNTFADELKELYKYYIINPNIPLSKFNELLDTPFSEWFDNVNTKEREYLDYIVIVSLKNTVTELQKLFNTSNINKWSYGKQHIINFSHTYNLFPFLDNATNIGTFELNGGISTLNYAEWSLNQSFNVVTGTSMRFIADLQNDVIYTIIPGGISGDPISETYSNQIQLWQIGAYIKLPVNEVPSNNFNLFISLLKK